MSPKAPPPIEYEQRLTQRRGSAVLSASRDTYLANTRFLVFSLALGLLGLSFVSDAVPVWSVGIPVVIFVALALAHDRVLRAKVRAEASVAFYERALDRLNGRWMGNGNGGSALKPEGHPYADDLDIFGEGSLFELLCTARTRAGEESLAGWLCAATEPKEVEARQAAVDELRDRIDLREECALFGGDVRDGVRPAFLASWAVRPRVLSGAWIAPVAIVLSAAAVTTLVGWMYWDFGAPPFFLSVFGVMIFWRVLRNRVRSVLAGMDESVHELGILSRILDLIDGESFEHTKLLSLQEVLRSGGRKASERIASLERILWWQEAQRNQMFAPVAFLLLLPVHFALASEEWRAKSGPRVEEWLGAVGEFEALCALAAYAYEHPNYPFPEVSDTGVVFDAKSLGHPLLDEKSCVRNDVSLGSTSSLLIVSGSNMSGKSTLLRSVGINTVLGLAGAPVCVESLHISPFRIGASIRIHDSIQSGKSRFYSEIERLRAIMELADSDRPTLFLLDELLHGTNSHDRRIGSVAILKGFLAKDAVGLVTTHDLSLTEAVSEFGPRGRNVHFQDRIVDDKLLFDYQLRPGVVQHGNALALMRAIGLDV